MKNIYVACFLSFALASSLFAFSQSGNVLSLDGANSYMSVADHADLDVAPGQTKTITCWIKTTSTATARIVAKRSGSSTLNPSTAGTTGTGYELWMGNGTNVGKIAGNAAAWNTTTSAATTFSTTGYNAGAANDGSWHHLAAVFDNASANKTVTFYLDGGAPNFRTGTFSNTYDFSTGVAFIVGAATNLTNFFNGQIDDVRFWNVAMTQAEVQADMTTVITGPATALLAAWNFENVTGPTVPDVSGHNHPGTLNGNASVVPVVSNMQYTGMSLLQTELPVGKGDADQRILAVNVTTTGTANPISLTSLSFTMNGTTSPADVSGIKIYYTGASNRFATTTQFATATPQSGTITATGSQALASGNNYFWIAYDVASGATENNVLDATCESITVSGTAYNFSSPNNSVAGSRTVFLTNKLLFSSGDYGSSNYRIPAVITAADGSLVTVTDKRWSGPGDLAAKIDPVVRRSTDGGQTWSAPLTIANFGGPNGAGDAALVLDKTKNPGMLLCLFAANQGFGASTPGNPIRIQYSKSTDNGITWSVPTDITDQVYGSGCSNPLTQGWYGAFVASGRMHQLRSGRIAGVLAVRQTSGGTIDNFMLYSDDGGTSWSVSPGIAAAGQANEAKIVELNNGNLMMSTRRPGARLISFSTDGGLTWGAATVQNQLVEPGCDGDFIRYSSTLDGAPQNVLLHSIPNNSSTRKNVSVFVSNDEGANWSPLKTIYPQASAYSSLMVLPDGTVGVYYECGEYETYQMYFARFSVSQLLVPLPVKLTGFATSCTHKGVLLNWETVQETNADFFEIQSSADGTNWTRLTTVAARGNSNAPLQYSYNDEKAQGKFYRLKMVDRDGKFIFSSVCVANCGAKNWKASVYPNPVKDKFELAVTGLQKNNLEIEIVNAQGQKVWQERVSINTTSGKTSIPAATLSKGLYYIKINDAGSQQIIPLIKQ